MKRVLIFVPLTAFLFFSCAEMKNAGQTVTDALTTPLATAKLFATANTTQEIGTANFYQEKDGRIRLELRMNMMSRADSNVALHIHEHGDCGDMGNNAHGHWNPTGENHGQWGSAHYHSGDLGNIRLNSLGIGSISIVTDRWSVSNASNNIIGKAIIVHGGTDDYVSQPSGNSGPRVGCGVIMRGK